MVGAVALARVAAVGVAREHERGIRQFVGRADEAAQRHILRERQCGVPVFVTGLDLKQAFVDELEPRELALPLAGEGFAQKDKPFGGRRARGTGPAHGHRFAGRQLDRAGQQRVRGRVAPRFLVHRHDDVEVAGLAFEHGKLFALAWPERPVLRGPARRAFGRVAAGQRLEQPGQRDGHRAGALLGVAVDERELPGQDVALDDPVVGRDQQIGQRFEFDAQIVDEEGTQRRLPNEVSGIADAAVIFTEQGEEAQIASAQPERRPHGHGRRLTAVQAELPTLVVCVVRGGQARVGRDSEGQRIVPREEPIAHAG